MPHHMTKPTSRWACPRRCGISGVRRNDCVPAGFRQMPRSIFQLLVAVVIDDAFSQPFRLVMLVLLSNHVKRDWTAGFAGEVAVERMTGVEPAKGKPDSPTPVQITRPPPYRLPTFCPHSHAAASRPCARRACPDQPRTDPRRCRASSPRSCARSVFARP